MNAEPNHLQEVQVEGPQPLVRDIPKGEDYPVEALGVLREAVEAVEDKTQAPVAIAAQSALSIASLAVQGFADVETLGGTAPSSLFCLTIARSGERKTGCDKLLMAGLRDFEDQRAVDYACTLADAEREIKLYEAQETKLIRAASGAGGKAVEARADLKAMMRRPELPLSPNRTATDPTFEGLVKLYALGHPSLGLFTDEGGGFFGGHAMNGENRLKTCAGLSGLWDGTPINRTRAGDGASTLRGRRLASHMMAQPVAVRPLLADPIANGQGFLARFLICEPESNIGRRTRVGYNPESDAVLARFSAKLSGYLGAQMPLREGTRNQLEPAILKMSESAKGLLWEYYQETERAQRPGDKFCHVTPYASKSAEQAARIAAVQTLWASTEANTVSVAVMADAITLARFYLSEVVRLANAAVVSEKIDRAETLRRWLLNSWAEDIVLPSQILNRGPNALRETHKIKEALKILESYGWVVPLPVGVVVNGKSRKLAYRIIRE
ncbi:YfjI family protein [Halocynthiibacter styelae]|uniref:DUF3987 domain-containing protein n=1 Tax=Halocynthiibacter styelae TaxID=2761955 RepID=A0A8J7IKB6_9RHOB|nr:YfjI family protein [Paenihalocynthiibacter styelae]MBI1494798.1 DUF3987 domain-containing protein [Paenihalocynthiibacter styelae]